MDDYGLSAGFARATLVLDAGIGLRAVTHALDGQPFTDTILFTHLHLDHMLELPSSPPATAPDA